MTDSRSIAVFEELLAVPSPSGREEQLAEIVRGRIAAMGYEHRTDPAGNVIVELPGDQADLPTVAYAAHMDEIGAVVTGIEPSGKLKVAASGALHPWKIGERPVTVIGDGQPIAGLLSMGSTHTPGAAERKITWQDVRIITGLSPDQLQAAGVRVGSTAVPVRVGRGPLVLGEGDDPLVAAWTFDDRMGVVALLRLLAELSSQGAQPARPTLVCFTVHEEGGCHGAKVLAHRERPEVFIAIDGCPVTADAPLALDGRPGVWSKDKQCHLDQRLVTAICHAGNDVDINVQVAVYPTAFSDATAVYATGGAPRVATFGHVRDNSHGYEYARLSVFENVVKVLLQFVKTWK